MAKRMTLKQANDFLELVGKRTQICDYMIHSLSNDERFALYKYGTGTKGSSASAPVFSYMVIDLLTGKEFMKCSNQKVANCWVQKELNGLELAPWFGDWAKDGKVEGNVFKIKVDTTSDKSLDEYFGI